MTGVSTWEKPAELEGVEFTDPVPDIQQVKQNLAAVQPAPITNSILDNEVDTGSNQTNKT